MTTLLVVEDEEKKASNFGFHSSFVFDSYMCFLKITTNGNLVRKREVKLSTKEVSIACLHPGTFVASTTRTE